MGSFSFPLFNRSTNAILQDRFDEAITNAVFSTSGQAVKAPQEEKVVEILLVKDLIPGMEKANGKEAIAKLVTKDLSEPLPFDHDVNRAAQDMNRLMAMQLAPMQLQNVQTVPGRSIWQSATNATSTNVPW